MSLRKDNGSKNGKFFAEDNPDVELELALEFYAVYSSFENALIQAGFTRPGRNHSPSQPDWERFARHIEGRFNSGAEAPLEAAVSVLLGRSVKGHDGTDSALEELPAPVVDFESDNVHISLLIQAAGYSLYHGAGFPSSLFYDCELLAASLFVLEAWSHCDPLVESILKKAA